MLRSEIIKKAEGIFLWVRLVLDTLIENLGKSDGPEELETRLTRIPKGLDAMYRHMLSRLEPEQLEEAMLYFMYVSVDQQTSCVYPTACEMELGFNSAISDIIQNAGTDSNMPHAHKLLNKASDRLQRIQGRGCGLLEAILGVSDYEALGSDQKGHAVGGSGSRDGEWHQSGISEHNKIENQDDRRNWKKSLILCLLRRPRRYQSFDTTLCFIHRSAHDFILRQCDEMKSSIPPGTSLRVQAEKHLLQSYMAQALILGIFSHLDPLVWLVAQNQRHLLRDHWKSMFIPFLDQLKPCEVRKCLAKWKRTAKNGSDPITPGSGPMSCFWSGPNRDQEKDIFDSLDRAPRTVFLWYIKALSIYSDFGFDANALLTLANGESSSDRQTCISLAYLAISCCANLYRMFDSRSIELTSERWFDTLRILTTSLLELLEDRAMDRNAAASVVSEDDPDQACDAALRVIGRSLVRWVLGVQLKLMSNDHTNSWRAAIEFCQSTALRLCIMYPTSEINLDVESSTGRNCWLSELPGRWENIHEITISFSLLALCKHVIMSKEHMDKDADIDDIGVGTSRGAALRSSTKAMIDLLETQGQADTLLVKRIRFLQRGRAVAIPEQDQQAALWRPAISLVKAALVTRHNTDVGNIFDAFEDASEVVETEVPQWDGSTSSASSAGSSVWSLCTPNSSEAALRVKRLCSRGP